MARHRRRSKTHRPPQEPRDRDRRDDGDSGPADRLQKVLAAAGIGSRRDCEEYIREGRVEIDRQVVTELGTRVDPTRQEIRVDGEPLRQPKRLYFAINKPEGVVTTNFDPSGRQRVIDLVNTEERVFAVGRLDRSSEGLILVTNDGEFSNRITHPRYGVEKTYLVRVAGSPGPTELARLRKGVYLSDGVCRVESIIVKSKHKQSSDLVIVLDEGRNRELRRILARVGHKVLRLKRIAIGPIKLADLPVGAWRRLMPHEIEALLDVARERRRAGKAKRKPGGPKPGGPKPVGAERGESPYLQQQALMAEPLSLDDLLRDDLDEGGPVSEPNFDADGPAFEFTEQDATESGSLSKPGNVIPYEEDEGSPPEKPVPHKPAPRKPPERRPSKRPGKPRFRPAQRSGEGERQADRPAAGGPGKKFAKPGGKRFGKPAVKKFGKRGGKSIGQSSARKSDARKFEKGGQKKFGKPGGRGKRRP